MYVRPKLVTFGTLTITIARNGKRKVFEIGNLFSDFIYCISKKNQIMGMPKMVTFGTLTIYYRKWQTKSIQKWQFYWTSLLISRNGHEFLFLP